MALGGFLFELIRRPWIARNTIDLLVDEVASTARIDKRGTTTINAICHGGPHDGLEFAAYLGDTWAIIGKASYYFSAKTNANGSWIFEFLSPKSSNQPTNKA